MTTRRRAKTVTTLATTDRLVHLRCDYCGTTWGVDRELVHVGDTRLCPMRARHGRLDLLADPRLAAYQPPDRFAER